MCHFHLVRLCVKTLFLKQIVVEKSDQFSNIKKNKRIKTPEEIQNFRYFQRNNMTKNFIQIYIIGIILNEAL